MLFFKNIQTGKSGEDIAQNYLRKLGYKVLERNWHFSKESEIDIIALDGDTLVFVEVKTRTNLNTGHPFESITSSKIEKIRKGILAYLNTSEKNYSNYRIDGIAIIGLKNPTIEHLKNIGQF